ncbi:TPA: hypothetical protein ACK3RK_008380 [Burkholderia cepacia]
MIVSPTGAIFYGICQVLANHCSAPEGGAITAVMDEHGNQINVCKTCLSHQVKHRLWNIEGASVPGMKHQIDIAGLNERQEVIAVIEVKTRQKADNAWAVKIATRQLSRAALSSVLCMLVLTPSTLFSWEVNEGELSGNSLERMDIEDFIASVALELGLERQAYTVESDEELRNAGFTAAKKHMQLERVVARLFERRDFLQSVPRPIAEILQRATFHREYVV